MAIKDGVVVPDPVITAINTTTLETNDVADTILADTAYIQDADTGGLTVSTVNSLAYRVAEIERHFHSGEIWYGKSDVDNFLEADKLAGFQVTAGTSEAFGSWLQLSDGGQISEFKYDMHEIFVTAASVQDALYLLQLGIGEAGAQQATTSIVFEKPSNLLDTGPIGIQAQRVLGTMPVWARLKCETNSATLTFLLGLHTYAG